MRMSLNRLDRCIRKAAGGDVHLHLDGGPERTERSDAVDAGEYIEGQTIV